MRDMQSSMRACMRNGSSFHNLMWACSAIKLGLTLQLFSTSHMCVIAHAGDFIVDDDGQGYADLGEEDDHWNGRGDRHLEEEDEEAEAPGGNKKRKGGQQAKGACRLMMFTCDLLH
eukprot:scaffold46248_cov21-Tisochrysis_lutea.AAC.3